MTNAPSSAAPSHATSSFSGAYADDFRTEYEQAPTDLARDVLRDGDITEAELQELYDALNRCLEPYGLQSTYSTDGGETMTQFRGTLAADEQSAVWSGCQAKTGVARIAGLHARLHANPDHLDAEAWDRASYRCFVTYDLLPKPIGEDEYIGTLTTSGMSGGSADDDQLMRTQERWNAFFDRYLASDDASNPNPDYDGANARKFWDCVENPLRR